MAGKRSEFFFHAVAFFIFASTIYHNIANIFIEGVTNSYGGRFKFLTFINLILSTSYFSVALAADCLAGLKNCSYGCSDSKKFQTNDKKKSNNFSCFYEEVINFRDTMFGSIIFPVGIIVTTAFWGVMAVDSELMLPSHLRHMIPVHGLYNHCAHSLPLFMGFIELTFVSHHNFPSKTLGLLIFSFFCVIYIAWLLWIAFKANIWVYPVLKVMSWLGVTVFLGGFYFVGISFFLLGYYINSSILATPSKADKVE